MAKWEKYILLNLVLNDDTLLATGDGLRLAYDIPIGSCFTTSFSEGYRDGYTTLGPRSLSESDRNTKIIIVSHGTPSALLIGRTRYDPIRFAEFLYAHGLRQAGMLAFKGCYLGRDHFLHDLARELVLNKKVGVNWLVGYRHKAYQIGDSKHQGIGRYDSLLREATGNLAKLPDSYRVTVVKGRPDAAAPGESQRYSHAYALSR